jgi:hypothetical protein
VPCHHVGVDVNGVDRITDGNAVLTAEYIQDVSAIALRPVRNEDLVIGDFHATIAEIVLGNGGAQEIITLLRAVAAKSGAYPHLLHRFVHGHQHGGRQRFGDVPNPAADQPLGGFRIAVAEHFHAPGNLWKQIAGLQFEIIVIQVSHGSEIKMST